MEAEHPDDYEAMETAWFEHCAARRDYLQHAPDWQSPLPSPQRLGSAGQLRAVRSARLTVEVRRGN